MENTSQDTTPDEVRDMFAGLLAHLVEKQSDALRKYSVKFVDEHSKEEIVETLIEMQEEIDALKNQARGHHDAIMYTIDESINRGGPRRAVIKLANYVSHVMDDAPSCVDESCQECEEKRKTEKANCEGNGDCGYCAEGHTLISLLDRKEAELARDKELRERDGISFLAASELEGIKRTK